MNADLDLSTFRTHEDASAEFKAGVAFVSPVEKWHYAVSFLCRDVVSPTLVEIDAEILCGEAGFGLNDASFSKYLSKEVVVRPNDGHLKVRILAEESAPEIALVVRNVSDRGERVAGIIHGIRLCSPSNQVESKSLDVSLFERFHDLQAKPEPGFITDFLGCRTRASLLWQNARSLAGTKLPPPTQGDYYGDALEWIGLLKSANSAQDRWVAIELGAGHGPWSVAGGRAARLQGISNIRLYAVEADPDRFRSLRQHFADNGFAPSDHVLIRGAAGASAGHARWPIAENAAEDFGARPFSGANVDYRGLKIKKSVEIPVFAVSELLRREPHWNLMHVDVQGDEVEVCRSSTQELNERVHWLIVGTHSRKIDGDLIDLLWREGWVLEHEKPSTFGFQRSAPTLEGMTSVDGTQVWRNPRFDRTK